MLDPLTGLDLDEKEQQIFDAALYGGSGKRPLKTREIVSGFAMVGVALVVITLYETGVLATLYSTAWFEFGKVVLIACFLGWMFWNMSRPNSYLSLLKKCYLRILELQENPDEKSHA